METGLIQFLLEQVALLASLWVRVLSLLSRRSAERLFIVIQQGETLILAQAVFKGMDPSMTRLKIMAQVSSPARHRSL